MKARLIITLLLFSAHFAVAQTSVGIGTTTPHSSAALDISSTDKGFLVPRMSEAQRLDMKNPTNGLLLYDSTLNRLYQFQDGQWKYMLTNASWIQSSTRNYTYSPNNNVGLGTASPTEKLDVNGRVRSRFDVLADGDITASGDINAASISAIGNSSVDGEMASEGNLTTYGNLNLDDVGTTVQLQTLNSKKGYFQLSGNNFRFGTNSGNAPGELIFRMNQKDIISVDRNANMKILNPAGFGFITIGWKLCRYAAPEINMLPAVTGVVPANGGSAGWISPFFTPRSGWSKTATGKYEITCSAGITANSVIIVTANEVGRICMAKYISPGKFGVETYSRFGTPVDCGFTYVVNDPFL